MAELQERKEKKRKDDIRSAVATAGEGVSICPHNGDLLCRVYGGEGVIHGRGSQRRVCKGDDSM